MGNRRKIFILGIDGATFDVIFPLIGKGKLPNMEKVMQKGVHGVLHSTIPSLSAPAWVAFMTGKNPGHYGTYHFKKINSGSFDNIYNFDLINSSCYKGDTFFDYLGKRGHKIGVMTVPVTYPPWEVNGFMVSGYPCPDPDENPNFTYPKELCRQIRENLNWTESVNSKIIPSAELRGSNDPEDILKGGISMMNRRTAYTLKFMEQFGCNVVTLVWGEIDRAQHMLWKYHDPKHVLYRPDNDFKSYIEHLYCHADKLMGEIIDCIGDETHLFIVSDHGFGARQGCYFHLNAWLNQIGYLKSKLRARILNARIINEMKKLAKKYAYKVDMSVQQKVNKANKLLVMSSIDLNKTRAYMFPLEEKTMGIVINQKGRQTGGIVREDECSYICNEIIELLRGLKDPGNGKIIVKECFKREEIYKGRKSSEAPDIILVLADGYLSGFRTAGPVFTKIPDDNFQGLSGTHRREGIFMACGPDLSTGEMADELNITDVAPTILYALGEDIPRDMEGKVLMSAFSIERLKSAPVYIDRKADIEFNEDALSSSEQESMAGKLKELGYM